MTEEVVQRSPMLRPSPAMHSPDSPESVQSTPTKCLESEGTHREEETFYSRNYCRSLLETASLECFCELTYGCYFKLACGSHFFVSKQETYPALLYDFPLVFGDVSSAVQHGGNNLIMAPGEILYVMGQLKLDEGGGVQMKGCHVRHYLPLSSEQYSQLLAHLTTASTQDSMIEVRTMT